LEAESLVSIADLDGSEIRQLIKRAAAMKKEATPKTLSGKTLALLFEKPSLRTRVSFDVAMNQLGGHCLYLSPQEVGLGKREPVSDVARVLSRYVDGIVARTFSQQTMASLAEHAAVPVINGLSDAEHPCQALSDLLTIDEKMGGLEGVTLAYVGDGNNVAHSLLLAASSTGMSFRIASPSQHRVREDVLQQARELASISDGEIMSTEDPAVAASEASVIYTDVWVSMGQDDEAEQKLKALAHYQVNESLLAHARKDAIIMHPLPAHHGEEVAHGLLDGPRSVVFDQAENRLHLQKALLAELMD
jgi:ornithine carbamoyltransferase